MSAEIEPDITEPVTTGDLGELTSDDARSEIHKTLFGDDNVEEIQQKEEYTNEKEEYTNEEGEHDDEEEYDDEEGEHENEEGEHDVEEEEYDDNEEEQEELNLDENPEEGELEEEEIEEDKETTTTQLRKLAGVNKGLQAENDQLNEQLVSKDQEMDNLRSQLDKMNATRVDPTSHPDFIDMRSKTHNGIATQLRRSIGTDKARALVGSEDQPRWGKILTDVATLDTLPFEEQDRVEGDVKLFIAQRLGFQGKELDPDIDADYIRTADSVIQTFGNFTPNYEELADLHQTILSKSQNKSLELGHKEYVQRTKSVTEGMALIETMSDKDIQEDPDSLQSLAAQKIRRSPEMKTRYEQIKKAVIEMAYGPQALSQDELDKHVATGKNMDEFHKMRQKRVETFRNERLTEIAAIMTLLPEIKKKMPEYFKSISDEERTKSKKKILRKANKVATKPKKKKATDDDKTVNEHRANIASALGM